MLRWISRHADLFTAIGKRSDPLVRVEHTMAIPINLPHPDHLRIPLGHFPNPLSRRLVLHTIQLVLAPHHQLAEAFQTALPAERVGLVHWIVLGEPTSTEEELAHVPASLAGVQGLEMAYADERWSEASEEGGRFGTFLADHGEVRGGE
jgi:hypothetical protein